MSKKNTLENKRLRKANKQKDRGYPEFYTQVIDDKGRSHLVGFSTPKQIDGLKKLFGAYYVNTSLMQLGLLKPEVVEGEVL